MSSSLWGGPIASKSRRLTPLKEHSVISGYSINREDCIRLVIAALRTFDLTEQRQWLEAKTGLSSLTDSYKAITEAVHNHQWLKALDILPHLEFIDAKGHQEGVRLIAQQYIAVMVEENTPKAAIECIQAKITPNYPVLARSLTASVFESPTLLSDADILDKLTLVCSPEAIVEPHRLEELIQMAKEYETLMVPEEKQIITGRCGDVGVVLNRAIEALGFKLEKSLELVESQPPNGTELDSLIISRRWSDALELASSPDLMGIGPGCIFSSHSEQKRAISLVLRYAIDDLISSPATRLEAVKLARDHSMDHNLVGEILISDGGELDNTNLLVELAELTYSSSMSPQHIIEYIFSAALKFQAMIDQHWWAEHPDMSLCNASILRDLPSNYNDLPLTRSQTLPHDDEVWEIAFSPDSRLLAAGTRSGGLYIWQNSDEGMVIHSLYKDIHQDGIQSMDWTHDGERLLTGGKDGKAVIVDVGQHCAIKEVQCTYNGEITDIAAVCWVPDGSAFFTGSYEGKLIKWSADGTKQWIFKEGLRVLSMCLYENGSKLAVLSVQLRHNDRTTHLLDIFEISTSSFVDEIELYTPLASLTVSQYSDQFLANIVPEGVRLWSPASPSSGKTLYGPTQKEYKVRSSFGGPFDKYIVCASEDKVVRVFNKYTMRQVFDLKGHNDVVNTAKWAPGQALIATASDDHTVGIWEPDLSV